MEDVTCIAAPRPLRLFSIHHQQLPPVTRRILSTPVEAFARFNLRDDDAPSADPIPLPQSPSPISPEPTSAIEHVSNNNTIRPQALSLPDETLEEFFAILRPQVFSPPLRFRRQHNHHHHQLSAGGGPSSLPRAHHPYRVMKKSHSSTLSEDSDRRSKRGVGTKRSSTATTTTTATSEAETPLTTAFEEDAASMPPHQPGPHQEWGNNNFELGSPISRTHTRNPLPRHPSYETLTSMLMFSPPPRPSNNPLDSSPRI